MIRAITAINLSTNNAVTMRLNGLRTGPFTLWKIDGIGPGTADINITDLASTDGGSYNSARKGSREITLTLVYNWFNGSIEAARHYSYQFFPLKKKVRLIIYSTDNLEQDVSIVKKPTLARYIDGYVTQNQPDIFSKMCATEIVLKCPDPYFYACNPILIDQDTVNPYEYENSFSSYLGDTLPRFFFPPNGYYSIGDDTIFGYELNPDIIYVSYPNYAIEVGGVFIFRITRNLSNPYPVIFIDNGKELFAMDFSILKNYVDFSNGLQINDMLLVSTIPGKKDIAIYRGSTITSVVGVIAHDSEWPLIYPGDNYIRVYSDRYLEDIGITCELQYQERYEGV